LARFYVPPSAISDNSFHLSGSEAHHAIHVLRKKVGDEIDLFDGKDASFRGKIERIDGDAIFGAVIAEAPAIALPIRITLFQALSRSAKWEWLLEKAGEIGVAQVVPIATRRSLIQLDEDRAAGKTERWNRIALAASKQCGRSDVMRVDAPLTFDAALKTLPKDALSLIPWEKENTRSVGEAVKNQSVKQINIFIGPEGGWDSQEVEQAIAAGVVPVRLGPTLLRTETAGLVAATLVLREFGIY
jgi:16S rRNA (uracil1498-N3)-methyltransferase